MIRGSQRLRCTMVLGVLAILVVPTASSLGLSFPLMPAQGGAMAMTGAGALLTSWAVPGAQSPAQASSATLSVAYTLDLCTNHLYPGNALPWGCENSGPVSVAYDSGKGEIFVTNNGGNNVSVISDSSNRVVASIPVGYAPDGVAYDSGKGVCYRESC